MSQSNQTPSPARRTQAKARDARAAPELSSTASQPIEALLAALNTSAAGLTGAAAAAILRDVGPNAVEPAKRKRLLFDFLERFTNPLVLILTFAAAVSAFTGDAPSFAIISAIVLMSVILDMAQEHQAQIAAERLRAEVCLKATVTRDGKRSRSPPRKSAGGHRPARGRRSRPGGPAPDESGISTSTRRC